MNKGHDNIRDEKNCDENIRGGHGGKAKEVRSFLQCAAGSINPSVKAFTVLSVVLLLAFQYNTCLNLFVLAACLLGLILFSKARMSSIVRIMIPAAAASAGMFFMGLYFLKGGSVMQEMGAQEGTAISYAVQTAAVRNLGGALALSSRILAYAGLGSFFVLSTDPEEFVSSLIHQCRLPAKFGYGMLAAFHLVPGMQREYDNIRLAFRVRGVKIRKISGGVIFAMLVNCIRWSDNVAMAMESRGFSDGRGRTYHEVPRVKIRDILFFALCAGSVAFAIFNV